MHTSSEVPKTRVQWVKDDREVDSLPDQPGTVALVGTPFSSRAILISEEGWPIATGHIHGEIFYPYVNKRCPHCGE